LFESAHRWPAPFLRGLVPSISGASRWEHVLPNITALGEKRRETTKMEKFG